MKLQIALLNITMLILLNTVEELMSVKGIVKNKFDKSKDLIIVKKE